MMLKAFCDLFKVFDFMLKRVVKRGQKQPENGQ